MPVATESDAIREFAFNVGRDQPDREWISTPYDTWERNPFFTGRPGRHPEDDSDLFNDPEWIAHIEADRAEYEAAQEADMIADTLFGARDAHVHAYLLHNDFPF